MAALIGGAAAASGSATSVTGSVENYSYDAGNYVVAWGDATFTAAGFSGDSGTPASADAATFVDVLGADFVFETSFHSSGTIAGDAVAASETRYLAVDIVGWDPPGGPLVMDFGLDSAHATASNDSYFPGLLDGNFASVSATADAFGADSMADTLTSALVVQDHFSSVSGWAAIGV